MTPGAARLNTPSTRLLLGFVLGLAAGGALAAAHATWANSLIGYGRALGGLWVDALRMTLIPLVFSMLVVGLGQAADTVRSGGAAARALIRFAALLLLSAAISALVVTLVLQMWPVAPAAVNSLRALAETAKVTAAPDLSFASWLGGLVPANPIKAAAEGAMAPVVVFAIAFSLAAARQTEARRGAVIGFFDAVQATLLTIIKAVLWVGPVGVFCLAMAVSARGAGDLGGFVGQYLIVISGVCLLGALIGLGLALAGGAKPRPLLAALAPVSLVALSTQSSAATLPVMLEATERLGAPAPVRSLVLPMAVAVFRIANPAGNLTAALYMAHISGVTLDPARLVLGVVVAALVSLAAVSVTSSATFMATLTPTCMAMGVPVALAPFFLSLEPLADFSRTFANTWADVGVTVWAGRKGLQAASSGALQSARGAATPPRSPTATEP